MLNYLISWSLIIVIFIYLYYNYLDDVLVFDLCFMTLVLEFLFSIVNASYIYFTDNIFLAFEYSILPNYQNIGINIFFIFDELSAFFYFILNLALVVCFYFLSEYFPYDFNNKNICLMSLLFSSSALMYFCSFDLFSLIFFWELIALISFFLIQYWSYRLLTYKAGLKVFTISQIGDLPFFFFIFLLMSNYKNTSFLNIFSLFFLNFDSYICINGFFLNFNETLSVLGVFSLLLKSAQFIFYPWLLDAMEAPVPISAQLHSSTLVIIGFYVYYRFLNMFTFSTTANYILTCSGFFTIIGASFLAFYQNDGKKLLACSTASQLGYIVLSLGLGLYSESMVLLFFCCINKAVTFIWFGILMDKHNGVSDFRFLTSSAYSKQTEHAGIFISICNFTVIPGGFSWHIKSAYLKGFFYFNTFQSFIFIILTLTWFFSSLYLIYLYTMLFKKNLSTKTTYWHKSGSLELSKFTNFLNFKTISTSFFLILFLINFLFLNSLNFFFFNTIDVSIYNQLTVLGQTTLV